MLGHLTTHQKKLFQPLHHHQYVPTVDCSTTGENASSSSGHKSSNDVKMHKILIAGDELTAARARGAKKHMANALTPMERLEGLVPTNADWHSKAALLGVSMTITACNC